MLVDADFCTIKIADFGFAAETRGRNNDGVRDTYLGTAGYMAPEILESLPYNGRAVDSYALGVILFAMVAQRMPFAAVNKEQLGGRKLYDMDPHFRDFILDK